MSTQHELSSRYPSLTITPLRPGQHAGGAIWRIHPRGSLSPTMWARTDEEAHRYAQTVERVSQA